MTEALLKGLLSEDHQLGIRFQWMNLEEDTFSLIAVPTIIKKDGLTIFKLFVQAMQFRLNTCLPSGRLEFVAASVKILQ